MIASSNHDLKEFHFFFFNLMKR